MSGLMMFSFMMSLWCIHRFTTAVVVEIAYGHRILSDDDKHAEIIEAVEHVLEIGGDLGTSPVDLLPIREMLPSLMFLVVSNSCYSETSPILVSRSTVSTRRGDYAPLIYGYAPGPV